MSSQLLWHETHPTTHSQITGLTIPHWDYTKTTILEIAKYLSFIPYIGWDVVITEEGFKILEGNDFPSLAIIQMHSPLLKDPQVRRFYEKYNVI